MQIIIYVLVICFSSIVSCISTSNVMPLRDNEYITGLTEKWKNDSTKIDPEIVGINIIKKYGINRRSTLTNSRNMSIYLDFVKKTCYSDNVSLISFNEIHRSDEAQFLAQLQILSIDKKMKQNFSNPDYGFDYIISARYQCN